MTIETLFKNLKKTVAYQEREDSSFYEDLGMRIKRLLLKSNISFLLFNRVDLLCRNDNAKKLFGVHNKTK